jgi:tetratricopeptide (TPR) repeat protein
VTDCPGVPEYSYLLAHAHLNLGRFLAHTGRNDAAMKVYDGGLTVAEQLAAQYPRVPKYGIQLGDFCLKLGKAQAESGATAEAERTYRQGIESLERLLSSFPDRPVAKEVLSDLCNGLGIFLMGFGRSEDAEAPLERALELSEQLAAGSDRPAYRSSLARDHHNRAGWLHHAGQHDEAAQHLQAALSLREKLAGDHPDVPRYRQDLAASHATRSVLLDALGSPEESLKEDLRASEILEELVADFPEVPTYQRDLAIALRNLAVGSRKLGRPEEAVAAYRDCLQVLKRMVDRQTAGPQDRFLKSNMHAVLGNLLGGTGQLRAASREWEHALALRKGLAAEFPGVARYENLTVGTLLALARLYLRLPDPERAVGRYRELLDLRSDAPEACHELAWLLANAARFCDPPAAVVLAERAVESKANVPAYWTTLGVARYRAGDFAKALEALERAAELGGGDVCDLLFSAMTCWKLGRRDEARRRYGKALQRLEESGVEDPELSRFRAEAEKLIE